MGDEAITARRAQERENLRHIIQQWNANRLDLFEISEPNEVSTRTHMQTFAVSFVHWFFHVSLFHHTLLPFFLIALFPSDFFLPFSLPLCFSSSYPSFRVSLFPSLPPFLVFLFLLASLSKPFHRSPSYFSLPSLPSLSTLFVSRVNYARTPAEGPSAAGGAGALRRSSWLRPIHKIRQEGGGVMWGDRRGGEGDPRPHDVLDGRVDSEGPSRVWEIG